MDSTLVELIKSYETYRLGLRKGIEEDSITGFILYLNQQPEETATERSGLEGWKHLNRKTLEEIAGSIIGKLGRYVDHYARKVMPLTALGSTDEFTYLVYLIQNESLTKTELIHHNIHPITSGTEIIKRLLKKGFIDQFDDEKDKRSVRVRITEEGRSALNDSFEKLGMVTKIVSAALTNEELIQLVNILKKSDDFHMKVFKENKNAEMVDIIKTYNL